MGVIGRAMAPGGQKLTREEEREMVASHRKGCDLARGGFELPAGADVAMTSGWQGEKRRMEDERKRAEAKVADRIDGYDRDDLGESPDF